MERIELTSFRAALLEFGRNLTPEEITQLELQGNFAPDGWDMVRLIDNNDSHVDITRIRGNTFSNSMKGGYIGIRPFLVNVSIGGILLPSGLFNSSFIGDCWIDESCRVSDTTIVSDIYLGKGSAIISCGQVSGGSKNDPLFGNKQIIRVGAEGGKGGRKIQVDISYSYSSVVKKAFFMEDVVITSGSSAFVSSTSYPHLSILLDHVVLCHCPVVTQSFIGAYAHIERSCVSFSCLASCASAVICVTDNATVVHSLLQRGSVAEKGCRLDSVFLMEHAHVGENARVSQSILAPDASVSGGECHHSLLGPSTGQSLSLT